jgi:drug/metabolite transporter (DMT)-like permease
MECPASGNPPGERGRKREWDEDREGGEEGQLHPVAVGLILVSAVAHVFWNYQVKRSSRPAICTWWLLVIGAALVAPVAVWLAWPISIPAAGWYCVAGTGFFYAGYYGFIARSYEQEDLSRAYPIARGVAPVATAALGVLFHRENPSMAGWLGIAGVSFGVLALAWPGRRGGKALSSSGVLAAVATGLCTAGYSAVDKEGVQHVHPALYIVLTFAAGALALGAQLRSRHGWEAFAAELRGGGVSLVAAAAVAIGGYLLVLAVLRTEPVSYVVPLRSVSVPLSVLAGAQMLGERQALPRFAAATLILIGITSIALGG